MENSTGKVVDIRKYKKVNNASPVDTPKSIRDNPDLLNFLDQYTRQFNEASGNELGDLIIKTTELMIGCVSILTHSYSFEELPDQYGYLNSNLIDIKPDYVSIAISNLLRYAILFPREAAFSKYRSILDKLSELRLAILDNVATEMYRTSGIYRPTISIYLDIDDIGKKIDEAIMVYEIRVRVIELFASGGK